MQKAVMASNTLYTTWSRQPLLWRRMCICVLLVWLSFCAGLLVFYVPGKDYAVVPEVWLPRASSAGHEAVLAQPVKAAFDIGYGVRFVPAYPDAPEVIEVHAVKIGMNAADCPDLYETQEVLPTSCARIGLVNGQPVYGITRRLPSQQVHAYTMRGDTLIALSGVYSNNEAIAHLRTFAKVARRDVNALLSANRLKVRHATATIVQEKRAAAVLRARAYQKVPFEPAMPAILPAGWVAHTARILGSDPAKPTGVEITYKKGSERFITLTMVPKAGFTMGQACGPTPGASEALVPCGPVPQEGYYAGGISGNGYATWFTYHDMGTFVAIMGTNATSAGGMLFSTDDLKTQLLIAKSLKPSSKDRLKGAIFVGTAYDPFPFIKP